MLTPRRKTEEVPQECDSTAGVKPMTKSTAQPQQRSQSLLVKLGLLGPEHAGDEPAREDPAAQLDVAQASAVPPDDAPLDETQPGVLSVVQPPQEDRLSRAIGTSPVRETKKKKNVDSDVPDPYLQIEHRADDVAHAAPASVIEYVSPISDVSAATAPVNEYAALSFLVCRQQR